MCENINIESNPLVSIIIPVRNEEKYLPKVLQGIKNQSYPKDKLEILFVDGNSNDLTINIINDFKATSSLNIRVLNNPKENAPSGVNMGISEASGEIIMRLDAHTFYPLNYVEKNLFYLLNYDADNVGCPICTVGEGCVGKSIAYICSSKFGVGNSKFRTTNFRGYVDTVPFGCFRKSLIDQIGFFDEKLPRSEDNDFNYRIRKMGGKVLMFSDIETIYNSRSNLFDLCKMAFNNGKGIIDLFFKDKHAIKIRHLIPLFFTSTFIIGLISVIINLNLIKYLFLIEVITYSTLDIIYSINSISKNGLFSFFICLFSFPLFHITYGFGSLVQIFKKILRR